MAVDVSAAAVLPPAATFAAIPEAESFDQRWAAWQARGAAHDRAVRRKMAIAAPIVIAVAAVIFMVFGR
jgi:hypothetical protein